MRTRKRFNFTPQGAAYVGRPTLWSNPFERRSGICHRRSVILYRHWLAGHLSPYILACARFSEAEIAGLRRWRDRLIRSIDQLRGRNLQCWCALTAPCHADVLLAVANAPHLTTRIAA